MAESVREQDKPVPDIEGIDDPTNLTDPVSDDELEGVMGLYVVNPAIEGTEGLPEEEAR